MQVECVGDSERKGGSLIFVRGLEVFTEDSSLVYVSPKASRNLEHPENQNKDKCPGIQMSSALGLEYAYDGFIWPLSPGPSLDVIDFKELINSLSL